MVVHGLPSQETIQQWETAVFIEEEDGTSYLTGPCSVKIVDGDKRETTLRIVMSEGKKRQIRRVASQLGHPVKTLIRTHIGTLALGTLRVGEWRDTLQERGLRVIAIHMPRYEADTEVEAVRDAISNYSITEPCAVDNEHKLKEAFQNDQGFVPAYYLFDGDGKLRSFAAGERGLDLLKSTLDRVLVAAPQPANSQT